MSVMLSAFRHEGKWIVRIDDIVKKEIVSNRTDVQLFGKRAYIGGRPGHLSLDTALCNY